LKSLTSAIRFGIVGVLGCDVVDEFKHAVVGLDVVGGQRVGHALSGADVILSVPVFSLFSIDILKDSLNEALLRCELGDCNIYVCQMRVPRVDVGCQCGFLGCSELNWL
jgi:translation elongation factor EF-4